MPPIDLPEHKPRVIIYHQTHFKHHDEFVSLLPLVTEGDDGVGVTHIIIAAIHLNEGPGNITLNDHSPEIARNERLWEEVTLFQDIGVKVLGLLGGAAKGSFQRLDGDDASFEAYYAPLRDMIRRHSLDGLDLDVEEDMSLRGITRLILRLKDDFGSSFLITLAPVATALQRGRPHLSGFDYRELESACGHQIAWYNVQFYNNWGALNGYMDLTMILLQPWPAEKIVLGVLTNPGLGGGYVEHEELQTVLGNAFALTPRLGGVMGWEYFNSKPGDEGRPWEWAHRMAKLLHGPSRP